MLSHLPDNLAITIIFATVLAVSFGILILRDRWRDHVDMPAAERQQHEQSASRWGTVFILGFIAFAGFLIYLADYGTPQGRRSGIVALMSLFSAFLAWARGRPRKSGKE